MKNQFIRILIIAGVFFGIMASGVTYLNAEEKNMKGWEIGSPYNEHYNVAEFEKFRAWVVKLTTVIPMEGRSPMSAVIVREGSETILVHVCPTWFAKPTEMGIRKGDRVKIKGCWAEIEGKDVFMASKIKKGDSDTFEFKVRLTKDGTPFWTMTKEQLAYERASK